MLTSFYSSHPGAVLHGYELPKLLTGNGIYLCMKRSAISHLASINCEKTTFRHYSNTFKLNVFLKRNKIKKIAYVVDL